MNSSASKSTATFATNLGEGLPAKERVEAALRTVQQFPELLDYYIRLKEDSGDRAEAVSTARVEDTEQVLVGQVSRAIGDLEERTAFYELPRSTYKECLERVHFFKSYIEDNDGYKLLNRGDGEAFSKEAEVHLAFGLVWCKTELDVNREPNNGRGPVDFKASYGASAKSLIGFKLASNTRLKQNLEKQVKICERANGTRSRQLHNGFGSLGPVSPAMGPPFATSRPVKSDNLIP
jgi:hypothetical protein